MELVTLLVAVAIVAGSWAVWARRRDAANARPQAPNTPLSAVSAALLDDLPESVFTEAQSQFAASVDSYWADQQREIVPECVVKPRTDAEVAIAVKIINNHFTQAISQGREPLKFAVRGAGHSAIPGFSNAAGGVVVDLSLLNHVELSADRSTVSVGGGAKWVDVSRKLDPLSLAVVGGRNGDVGVGGLTLGGGYSFYSPRKGFVCDNVAEYRIVLASGETTTASEQHNHDLWRALKGGGNNFGIVTNFTLRVFLNGKLWGGFLYMTSSKIDQTLHAFHRSLETFDEYAAGPLVCITWLQKVGFRIISLHLMYTKPEVWPTFWQPFGSIGRLWSTTKIRSLTSATEELDSVAPARPRKLHMSTVIKNDLGTLQFAHTVFEEKIGRLKKVKGMTWTLVFQPVHASSMQKGRDNVLGLQNRTENLVVVLFAGVWEQARDDMHVNEVAKTALDNIRRYAADRGMADDFCYVNWCPNTSTSPFLSYGAENVALLKRVGRAVDPDGLFQRGCVGGYKLVDVDA